MAIVTKHIKADCSVPNRFKVTVSKQGDVSSRYINAEITDYGGKVTIENGDIPLINCKRADGQKKAFSGIVESDGTVTVPIPNWLLELKGSALCDISVLDIDNEVRLTTLSFTIEVQECVYNTSDPDDDDVKDILNEVLAGLEGKVDIQQDILDVGKYLGIGANGKVHPVVIDTANFVLKSTLEQTTGTGTDVVMSQNAVTTAIAAAIASIGTVFKIRGNKPTASQLPMVGNAIGDVWYVEDESAGYIWIEDNGVQRWEALGKTTDLSAYYTKTEANAKFNEKLTAGEGITIQNNVISASVGTVDYTKLENLPREPYTPEAETVDFLGLADGKVYDAMGDFTLARYNGQAVVTSIDVHAGDMFSVGEYNSTDGYSMIALFCNQGVFSFQSNLDDWSNGYLPNAYNIDASLVVKPLPVEGNTESGTLTYECDVTDLADGVYIAEQTTVLTGWVSGTLAISKTTEVKKVNDVVIVGLDAYTNYDLSTNVALYASMQELDRQIATRQPRSLYFKNVAVAATEWVANDVADTSDYAYKAEIHCVGVTMEMRPRIDFTIAQDESGNYCRYADTSADTVTIYSNDNSATTIPLITAEPTSEGAGLSLSTVQTYIGNFLDPDIVVTDGAIDKYNRTLVS